MSTDYPRRELRIGDAEREAAVSALGDHYAAGRLTKEEYDERADRASAARTGSDLAPLFEDLPGARRDDGAGHQNRGRKGELPRLAPIRFGVPWVPLVVGVVILVALGHLWPLLLIGGLLWCTGVLRPGRVHHSRGTWSHPGP